MYPLSVTFQIQLDKEESEVFTKCMPGGSRDIEAFVEEIREEASSIHVVTEDEEGIYFNVEVDSEQMPVYSVAKREASRIARAIERLLKGE